VVPITLMLILVLLYGLFNTLRDSLLALAGILFAIGGGRPSQLRRAGSSLRNLPRAENTAVWSLAADCEDAAVLHRLVVRHTGQSPGRFRGRRD
jgi:hypothetical protein